MVPIRVPPSRICSSTGEVIVSHPAAMPGEPSAAITVAERSSGYRHTPAHGGTAVGNDHGVRPRGEVEHEGCLSAWGAVNGDPRARCIGGNLQPPHRLARAGSVGNPRR